MEENERKMIVKMVRKLEDFQRHLEALNTLSHDTDRINYTDDLKVLIEDGRRTI